MTAAIPMNMRQIAREALRTESLSAEREAEALMILDDSPDYEDHFLVQQLRRTFRADMDQIQPDEPQQRLEPGGLIGCAIQISIGVLIGAVVLTAIGLTFDAPATLNFLTLGGFDVR